MKSLNDDERREVLGEVFLDELKVIRGYVEDIPEIKRGVKNLKNDFSELKSDMKAVIKDHNKQLNSHEHRIKRLELAHN